MNVSKMYVPNVEKWMRYYKDIASGKENVYMENSQRNVKQRGGGLSQNSNEFMIDIDKKNRGGEKSLPAKTINFEMISPAQQVVEQAKSELKREHSLDSRHSFKRRRGVHTSTRKLKKKVANKKKSSIKKKPMIKKKPAIKKKPTIKKKPAIKKKPTIKKKPAIKNKITKKNKSVTKRKNNFLSKWLQ